jgi:hypothetical protein
MGCRAWCGHDDMDYSAEYVRGMDGAHSCENCEGYTTFLRVRQVGLFRKGVASKARGSQNILFKNCNAPLGSVSSAIHSRSNLAPTSFDV